MSKKSVFEIVTENILEKLMEGVVPWQQPYAFMSGATYNRVSGKSYSLINRMVLGRPGEYATYKQWQTEGFQVNSGERSGIVTFWTEFEDKKADPIGYENDGTPIYPKFPCLRYYNVFHIAQTDCPEPKKEINVSVKKFEDNMEIEKAINAYCEREGVKLDRVFGSNCSFYDPDTDKITVPANFQFEDAPSYYDNLFREIIRSTGTKERIGRVKNWYQKEEFSKESLVAEIASACLMNEYGIDTEKAFNNSISYIDGWMKALNDDPRMIVSAASQAEKAIEYFKNGKESKKEQAA